jgi:hypothetical protein
MIKKEVEETITLIAIPMVRTGLIRWDGGIGRSPYVRNTLSKGLASSVMRQAMSS